jgi:hypothetical protein
MEGYHCYDKIQALLLHCLLFLMPAVPSFNFCYCYDSQLLVTLLVEWLVEGYCFFDRAGVFILAVDYAGTSGQLLSDPAATQRKWSIGLTVTVSTHKKANCRISSVENLSNFKDSVPNLAEKCTTTEGNRTE